MESLWKLIVPVSCCLQVALGHGRLIEPPSRSSMWRYGFKNPPNYNDNQLSCGGRQVQWEVNGGRCGVCGDPWQGPRDNEPGGKYANGIIVQMYKPGQVIDVVIDLTANHKGWFEFRLCPNDDPMRRVTQYCFDQCLLPMTSAGHTRYFVPKDGRNGKIALKVFLPKDIKCRNCVLQWKYNAGNSWGVDPQTGTGCVGCGPQEQFYGCADISIGYFGANTGKELTAVSKSKLSPTSESSGEGNQLGNELETKNDGWKNEIETDGSKEDESAFGNEKLQNTGTCSCNNGSPAIGDKPFYTVMVMFSAMMIMIPFS